MDKERELLSDVGMDYQGGGYIPISSRIRLAKEGLSNKSHNSGSLRALTPSLNVS